MLVAAGALGGVDQWAIDATMQPTTSDAAQPTFLESVVPLLHSEWGSALTAAGNLVTLPGQVVASFLLVAGAAEALRRQRRVELAAGWLGAWALGTAIEVVCKEALVRPPLERGGEHLLAFDSSWPSGHTLRGTLVALAVASAWPRARPLVAAWLAAGLVLLEVDGYHTVSDILGGLLLAAALAASVREVEASALLRRRAALRSGLRRGRAGPAARRGRGG